MTISPAGAAPNVPVVAPAPTCSASARAFAASRLVTSTVYPALAARPPIAAAIPPDPMMLMVLTGVFLSRCRAAPLFPLVQRRYHLDHRSRFQFMTSEPLIQIYGS